MFYLVEGVELQTYKNVYRRGNKVEELFYKFLTNHFWTDLIILPKIIVKIISTQIIRYFNDSCTLVYMKEK